MYNFMHLNVPYTRISNESFCLYFCSGRCRVYFYRGNFGFADAYSSQ